MTFAFYDLETTGLDPAFDQALQFAAILTDDDFDEIERVDFRCRIAPHILPSPHAMAVTGVSPENLSDPALPSYFEFSQSIRSLIQNWSPATWVGYNTIEFDETFLRQMFYQTLQPDLYETQFNGNDRLDIMLAVQSAWAYEPTILEWPRDTAGNPVLKLDQLAQLNGLTEHDAHDALGDVEATIHIARLIRHRLPDLWASILANRDKNDVSERLNQFAPMELVLRFAGPPQISTGCLCGFSADSPNNAGFFDLELADPADFVDADDETLAKAVSGSPKIIRKLSINKVPNLFPTRSKEQALFERASLIESRPDFQKRVGQALAARFKDEELPDDRPVETRIYEGFYSKSDKALLREFQAGGWPERASLIGQFEDIRLQQLGRRLVALNSPEPLDQRTKSAALNYLREKWLTPAEAKPKWTSFETAEKDLVEIEGKQLIAADALASWRAFYAERRRILELGELP